MVYCKKVGAVKYYCSVVCTTTASRVEHYWSCHGVLLVGVASSSGALLLLLRSLRNDLEKWERLYGASQRRSLSLSTER